MRQRYLNDEKTSEEIKTAIKNKKVVLGMCPLQAFASAGFPGPYLVKRDQAVWSRTVPPPSIVQVQCESPDKSEIELLFRNTEQFDDGKLTVFRVRFEMGRAVLIDQKGFSEN